MIKKRLFVIAIIIITSINTFAQKEKIQSVLIYNFITKYFEWPASSKSGDFYIGVLGQSPIIDEFNTIAASRKVGNQKIVIKEFNSASEVTSCHVLYISESKDSEAEQALEKSGNTLIITDSMNSSIKGSAINFKTVDKKQKFELKAYNATSRGLVINPALGEMLTSQK